MDATEKLSKLEATAREAGAELAEIRGRLDERARRRAHLRAEKLRLAVERPKDFDVDGQPKKGTEAAEVQAQLDRDDRADDTTLLSAADERARQARRAVNEYQRDQVLVLMEELQPDAEAAVAAIREHLDGLMQATDFYFEVERRATAILVPVQGLDGQDLPPSDRIAALRKVAKIVSSAMRSPLPLPRSVVPQPGFPPVKVPGPEGGWIRPQNAREEKAAA
jgi:hypothetical protein